MVQRSNQKPSIFFFMPFAVCSREIRCCFFFFSFCRVRLPAKNFILKNTPKSFFILVRIGLKWIQIEWNHQQHRFDVKFWNVSFYKYVVRSNCVASEGRKGVHQKWFMFKMVFFFLNWWSREYNRFIAQQKKILPIKIDILCLFFLLMFKFCIHFSKRKYKYLRKISLDSLPFVALNTIKKPQHWSSLWFLFTQHNFQRKCRKVRKRKKISDDETVRASIYLLL